MLTLRGPGGVLIQFFLKMSFWMFLVDLNEIFQKLFTELKNIDPGPSYRHSKLSDQAYLDCARYFNRDYLKTMILGRFFPFYFHKFYPIELKFYFRVQYHKIKRTLEVDFWFSIFFQNCWQLCTFCRPRQKVRTFCRSRTRPRNRKSKIHFQRSL